MAKAKKVSAHRVIERDNQGRPIKVDFTGDPATQCPACLSHNVESYNAIGWEPVGDGTEMSPIRRTHCLACGGSWTRPGL
jgi:hypothetical protein